jgi:hypothetical protein
VVVSGEDGPTVVLSRWVSFLALVFCLLAVIATVAARRVRRRRGG